MKNKKLKPCLILFIISILVVLILSVTINTQSKFLIRLSNNLFIVGTVFLIMGVIFRISAWSVYKKHIRKKPVDEEELKVLKYSHKDAVTVSNIKKLEQFEKRRMILKLLWKNFIFVGFADFMFSIVVLIFI